MSAAVSLSTTIIGPPHLGQDQRSLGPAVEASCSVSGAALSSWKQGGKVVARLRLARKPKLRKRTKPSGSRCNRKRRKNSSRDRGGIAPTKRDLPISKRDQSMVGDGYAMSVTAQITEYML
jgi:hypothetical protein